MGISARAVLVVRKGRKRKAGPRHPCGQLIDPSKEEVTEHERVVAKLIAINQPHRRELPRDLRHDAKAESVLGRLQLGGKITKDEWDAGRWYAGVVARYRASIFGPNPNPGSITGAQIVGAGGKPFTDDEESIRRKAVYDAAFEALDRKGQRFAKAVARTAVFDESPKGETLIYLQEGLHALSIHKGLTRDEDRAIKIKTQENRARKP